MQARAVAKAAPVSHSVLDLTRDAGSGSYSAAEARYPWGDLIRWVLASTIVIIGIVFLLRFLKKRGIGVDNSQKDVESPSGRSHGSVLASIPLSKGSSSGIGDKLSASLANVKMGGDLEVVGAQPLNGSGNVLFLVRAGDRMLLLNSNPNTGVKPVSEWDADDDLSNDEPPTAFGEYLKQSNGLRLTRAVDDEASDAVRTRLTQAANRLARISTAAPREQD
jgi:hypothetical protein